MSSFELAAFAHAPYRPVPDTDLTASPLDELNLSEKAAGLDLGARDARRVNAKNAQGAKQAKTSYRSALP